MTYNEWLIYKLNDYIYHKYGFVIFKTGIHNLYASILNDRYEIDSHDFCFSLSVDLKTKEARFEDLFNEIEESPTYRKNIITWLGNKEQYSTKVPSMELEDWKTAIDKIMTEVVDNPEIKNHLVSQFK